MDLKRNYLHMIPSFVVAASLILSACQEGGQTRVRIAKGGGATGDRAETMERTELTPEQKRYSQDPLKLAAYEHVLAPMFSKMDAEAPTPWSALLGLKRWVITPSDIKKDVPTPVSISMADYGDFARQTMYDIFVDISVFEKRNENEQADIILNEFLTSLYTFKNFSDDQLCKLIKTQFKDAEGCDTKKTAAEVDDAGKPAAAAPADEAEAEADAGSEFTDAEAGTKQLVETDKNSKTEKLAERGSGTGKANNQVDRKKELPKKSGNAGATVVKALEREDYIKIDRVKKYILGEGEKLRHGSLVAKLRENGFDIRVFSYKMIPKKARDPLTLDAQIIKSLFDQANALNQTTQNCYFVQLANTSPCAVTVRQKVTKNPDNGTSSTFHKFELKLPNKEPFFSEIVYQMAEVKISKLQSISDKEELYLIPLSGKSLENPAEGVPYRMNYMLASKTMAETKETWTLEGVFSIPGTVTKVSANETGGVSCEGKLAEAKNESTDLLLLSGSDKYFGLIKEKGKSLPVYPPCW